MEAFAVNVKDGQSGGRSPDNRVSSRLSLAALLRLLRGFCGFPRIIRDFVLIENSRIFDAPYYLDRNPDVMASGMNPLMHYIIAGASEGRNPSPFFDTKFYCDYNPDVQARNMNPLVHYVRYGASEGRDPCPEFSTRYYASTHDDLGKLNPLAHFIIHGQAEGWKTASSEYERWVRAYDTLTGERISSIRVCLEKLGRRPLISIVMPAPTVRTKYVEAAIRSVCCQVYDRWELCIGADEGANADVRGLLSGLQASDRRIKVTFLQGNERAYTALNAAMELATGDFVAFLDPDAELRPHSLYMMAEMMSTHPDADVIYSDEDKIDDDGCRHEPHFKPDWNPDLVLGRNYLGHLLVIRRDVIQLSGGLGPDAKGTGDWDLVLRVTEQTTADRIRHVPSVLYHGRMQQHPALQVGRPVFDSQESTKMVLEDAMQRRKTTAEPIPMGGGCWRLRRAVPEPHPMVSLLILTRNRPELLKTCVDSVLTKTKYSPYEIVIVDNGSDDGAAIEYLAKLAGESRVRVLRYKPDFNFSAMCNFGVAATTCDIIGLLNNDTEVISEDWLSEMVSHAVRPEIGAVGAKLLYRNNTVQHAGILLGIWGRTGHAFKGLRADDPGYAWRNQLVQNYSALTGACLLLRKALYLSVNGMDEARLPVSYGDVDLCLKIQQKGFRNLFTPFALLYHDESASRGLDDTIEKMRKAALDIDFMKQRWGEAFLMNDPSYNPNLSRQTERFDLAFPPFRPLAPEMPVD